MWLAECMFGHFVSPICGARAGSYVLAVIVYTGSSVLCMSDGPCTKGLKLGIRPCLDWWIISAFIV